MAPLLPRHLGHYRLEERLAAGGMGVVYRAVDVRTGAPVAVKTMLSPAELGADADLQEIEIRFFREARAAAAIDSPHIARVLEIADEADDEPHFAMELLEGRSLSELLIKATQPGQGLAVERVLDLMQQVCAGLEAAHAAGFVHRDLKPSNIMVVKTPSRAEHVKLLDFGVAKRIDDPRGDPLGPDDRLKRDALTQKGDLLGTLPFMAPEQIRNEAVDGRTDLYAVGVILFRMLTGTALWPAQPAVSLYRLQLEAVPPSLFTRVPEGPFSGALDDVIARCLQKSPTDRFPSAQALSTALAAAVAAPLATVEERHRRVAAHRATMSPLDGGGTLDGVPGTTDVFAAPQQALPRPVSAASVDESLATVALAVTPAGTRVPLPSEPEGLPRGSSTRLPAAIRSVGSAGDGAEVNDTIALPPEMLGLTPTQTPAQPDTILVAPEKQKRRSRSLSSSGPEEFPRGVPAGSRASSWAPLAGATLLAVVLGVLAFLWRSGQL